MEIVGYTDRLSVRQTEAIKFMVSCRSAQYDATFVRLIHGDTHPLGPGFKEEEIASPINRRYPGREQFLYPGSYVFVPDAASFNPSAGLTIQAWIFPTTPTKVLQGVVTKWGDHEDGGYGLFLMGGELAFWVRGSDGNVSRVKSGQPMRARTWYFVAATYDPSTGTAHLTQHPVEEWPNDPSCTHRDEMTGVRELCRTTCPLLIAAHWQDDAAKTRRAAGFFNGKIDRPKLFSRALTVDELAQIRRVGQTPAALAPDVISAWDFSRDPASDRAVDTSARSHHGKVVNSPARAMVGYNWVGRETDFKKAPNEYGAIYFHDDDLDDAGWESDFELRIPTDLASGVYAVRLNAGGTFDYVPFFVRPAHGCAPAKILLLAPTFSYMAYGNEHLPSRPGRAEKLLSMNLDELLGLGTEYEQAAFRYMHDNRLTSLYEFHTDGSGVAYTTRRRPLVNMRPLYRKPLFHFKATHQFNEDLYLVAWLYEKKHVFDVATDEDLHSEGIELLDQYRVVLTGSHPEYWTDAMYTALETYLRDGGRLMYLGGNGFYWVTSVDPQRPHIIEVRRGESGPRTCQADPGEYYHSTTGELGGLWRFRHKTPHRIVGIGLSATGGEPARPYRRQPGSFDRRAAFMFEGIGKNEILGDFGLHMGAAAGWELDRADATLGTPPHALVVASSFGHSDSYQLAIEDLWKTDPNVGGTRCPDVRADIVYLEYPNGGAVFSVGSITYCASLPYNNFDNNISRLTDNVLRAFASDKSPAEWAQHFSDPVPGRHSSPSFG